MTYLQLFFPALLILWAAAMLWHVRSQSVYSRRGLWLVFIAVVLFCLHPAAWLLSGTLEWAYSAGPPLDEEADAIVVLGGGEARTHAASPVAIPAQDTYVRCRHAAWLHGHFPDLPILVCGGGGVAESMKDLLIHEGVPSTLVALEPDSSSTYENALFGAEILKKRSLRRILLVTEAHHMLRAELSFEQQDMKVVPAPCGFRSEEFPVDPGSFLPGATAIRQNEEALHEWLGLAWYWIRGRI